MVSEKFRKALKFVLKWEGGLSDDPDDPGGRTYKGVTQARYNQYRKSKGLPLQDVAKMSDQECEEIYWEYYWLPVKGEELPPPLDLVVFDTGVNMGTVTAIKLLQRAINDLLPQTEWIAVDGVIGKQTFSAIEKISAQRGILQLCSALLNRREERYKSLVKANPRLQKFLKVGLTVLTTCEEPS